MLRGEEDQIIEVGCNVKPKSSPPFSNVIPNFAQDFAQDCFVKELVKILYL
jgi:hypothetical protein